MRLFQEISSLLDQARKALWLNCFLSMFFLKDTVKTTFQLLNMCSYSNYALNGGIIIHGIDFVFVENRLFFERLLKRLASSVCIKDFKGIQFEIPLRVQIQLFGFNLFHV